MKFKTKVEAAEAIAILNSVIIRLPRHSREPHRRSPYICYNISVIVWHSHKNYEIAADLKDWINELLGGKFSLLQYIESKLKIKLDESEIFPNFKKPE